MKALVHIGAPKTGTSSIQSFLYRNAAALAAQGARYEREVAHRGSQFEYPMAAMLARGVLPRQEEQKIRYRAVDAAMQARVYGGVAERLKSFPRRHAEPLAVFSSEHCLPWLHTDDLVAAFGEEYERLDGQPAGSNREGFLGRFEYRRLMAERNDLFNPAGVRVTVDVDPFFMN